MGTSSLVFNSTLMIAMELVRGKFVCGGIQPSLVAAKQEKLATGLKILQHPSPISQKKIRYLS